MNRSNTERLFASRCATMPLKVPHGLISSRQHVTSIGKFTAVELHCKNMENEPARTLPCTQPTLVNVWRDNPDGKWWAASLPGRNQLFLSRATCFAQFMLAPIPWSFDVKNVPFPWRNLVLFLLGPFPFGSLLSAQREVHGKPKFPSTVRRHTSGKSSFFISLSLLGHSQTSPSRNICRFFPGYFLEALQIKVPFSPGHLQARCPRKILRDCETGTSGKSSYTFSFLFWPFQLKACAESILFLSWLFPC